MCTGLQHHPLQVPEQLGSHVRSAYGQRGRTWATTTALWYSRTSGVGGVRGSRPFCCRFTLVGEALLEVVTASCSCRAANLLHPHRPASGRTSALRGSHCGQ